MPKKEKEPACQRRGHKRRDLNPWVRKSLEGGIAAHSSILGWRLPWTEDPGGLQSMSCKELDMTEVTKHTHTDPLHHRKSQ